MDLKILSETAAALFAEHRLGGWVFGLSASKRRLGVCKYRRKRIEISEFYARHNPDAAVLDTLRHEIANALAGPCGQARPGVASHRRPHRGDAEGVRRLARHGGGTRRLAGHLWRVRSRTPQVQTPPLAVRLPLQVPGTHPARVRLRRRPGPRAAGARCGRTDYRPLARELCRLWHRSQACPTTEGGRVAVPLPSTR
jgi:hypothetical protein